MTRREPAGALDGHAPVGHHAPALPPSSGMRVGHLEARFLTAAVVALALFATTYWAFVTTEIGQNLENLAVRGAELQSPAIRDASLERLSPISVATFGLAITLTFLIAVLRRRLALGALAAGIMVISVVAAEILKELLPRPVLSPGPAWILRNSFPSGTAAVATSFAVGALLVVPDRLRWVVLPVGALFVAVIGDAIQTTGWHRLSDTIGSTLLVAAVASGGLAVLARAGLTQPSSRGLIPRPIWVGLAALPLAVFIIATVLLLLMLAFPLLISPEGGRRAFLQTAFPLFGAAFTILVLLVFGRMVEPLSLGQGRPHVAGARPERESAAGDPAARRDS